MNFGSYANKSEIKVGDVLILATEIGSCFSPFSTCVVSKIENDVATLVRPMLKVDDVGGSIWTHHETFSQYLDSIVKNERYFVTGKSGDKYSVLR